MSELNHIDDAKIKKYCLDLMANKFFCRYSDNKADRDAYVDILSTDYVGVIRDRLFSVGFELVEAQAEKTVYAIRQKDIDSKKYMLTRMKSIVVLTLLKKYIVDIKHVDTDNVVYYSWNDFLDDVNAKNNSEKNDVIDAVWFFKEKNLIGINSTKKNLRFSDDDDAIKIALYPAIQCFCPLTNLNDAIEKLESYIAKKDENIDQLQINIDTVDNEDEEYQGEGSES